MGSMKRFFYATAIVVLTLPATGCVARLLLLEDAQLLAVRRAAMTGVAETRVAGGLARAARMGITAEEIALMSRSTATIRAGRLVAADEVAFNSALGRIQLVRGSSGNPRLYLRGAAEPFAEVLVKDGRIRLFTNSTFRLHSDIYSVERSVVVVRSTAVRSSGNTVATLRQGDLVVKLAEDNGWYHVQVIQGATELTGFVEAALLAPLVMATASRDSSRSPQQTIADEERRRWDHYWATIEGRQVSAQDAMSILYTDFGQRHRGRAVSYRANDWPAGVRSFVRVTSDNLPILSTNSFKDPGLRIVGFTTRGELLQYLSFKHEWVKLDRPGDWGPKNYGEWYQVRTLSGEVGWLFTKPHGQGYSSGRLESR
jgi:hypothetical protein